MCTSPATGNAAILFTILTGDGQTAPSQDAKPSMKLAVICWTNKIGKWEKPVPTLSRSCTRAHFRAAGGTDNPEHLERSSGVAAPGPRFPPRGMAIAVRVLRNQLDLAHDRQLRAATFGKRARNFGVRGAHWLFEDRQCARPQCFHRRWNLPFFQIRCWPPLPQWELVFSDMIRRVASSPSMPGSRMSMASTTSGEISSKVFSASSALAAVAQTSSRGSRLMLYSSSALTTGESSTIMTRIFFVISFSSYHLPDRFQQFGLIELALHYVRVRSQ